MGKRGPAPTPTVTLQARGSWRAKSRAASESSAPRPGRPTCPSWLSDEARHCWARIVVALEARDSCSPDYHEIITAVAVAWSRFVTFSKMLAATEDTDKLKRLSTMTKSATADLVMGLGKLGLTPTDHLRVANVSNHPQPNESKSRFFRVLTLPEKRA